MTIHSMIYYTWDDHYPWCPQRKGRWLQKMLQNALHIITMTGAAGRVFTYVDILYTSFHSIPLKNFDITWVKVSWFLKKRWVLSIALSPHTQWCFGVWNVLLQRWSLVTFGWLHKHVKLSCLVFREPSHFLNNIVEYSKNWCLVHHVENV